jgi:predicted O-linked N-acetylglucosamine transferase (SPINDLY family)
MSTDLSAQHLAAGVEQCLRLFQQSRLDAMEALAGELVRTCPSAGRAWQMLGIARLARGNATGAIDPLQQAGTLAPQDAGIWDNLGAALNASGEFDRAAAAYERSLQLDPNSANVLSNAAANAGDGGRDAAARAYAERALALDPALAQAHLALGNAAARLGDIASALDSLGRAVRLAPALQQAHLSLGNALQLGGDTPGAIGATQRAAELAPNYADAQQNLGRFHHDLGHADLAARHYRAALRLQPQRLDAWSGWLFCLAHDANIAAADLFAAHREFGEFVERPWRARWGGWDNPRNPDKRLRVGFVSGDLREHAVAHFIEPIWRALDRNAIEIVAYATHPAEDALSAELTRLADAWHNVATLSDNALEATIRGSNIDILIDLAGHTAHHRLGVFARKPAPLQVSWIGYPNTTGLMAVDYRLIGNGAAQPGELDAGFSEKLVHMPLGTVFEPPPAMPPVNPLPALAHGYLTFGSFNRPIKLSEAALDLWIKVMNALPDSRMLIAAVSEACVRERIAGRFAAGGVAADRLAFHPRKTMDDYLKLHHEIDLILDTFPFTGGTVTNQALWMGVPTLTLSGDTLPRRQGAGIMIRAGLGDWVAQSEAGFVERARAIACNPMQLAGLRARLRPELAAGDPARTAQAARLVETALRTMWRRWCAGAPAQSFQVAP